MKVLGQRITGKKAIEMDGENASGRNNLALAYFDDGDYEKALEEFILAIKLDYQNATYYNNLGKMGVLRKRILNGNNRIDSS